MLLRALPVTTKLSHAGFGCVPDAMISTVCPLCSGWRGEPYPGLSYDGSRRLAVDCWQNACGHVDMYAAVREEAGVTSCSERAWPHG